jgi:hypothetical protein
LSATLGELGAAAGGLSAVAVGAAVRRVTTARECGLQLNDGPRIRMRHAAVLLRTAG